MLQPVKLTGKEKILFYKQQVNNLLFGNFLSYEFEKNSKREKSPGLSELLELDFYHKNKEKLELTVIKQIKRLFESIAISAEIDRQKRTMLDIFDNIYAVCNNDSRFLLTLIYLSKFSPIKTEEFNEYISFTDEKYFPFIIPIIINRLLENSDFSIRNIKFIERTTEEQSSRLAWLHKFC